MKVGMVAIKNFLVFDCNIYNIFLFSIVQPFLYLPPICTHEFKHCIERFCTTFSYKFESRAGKDQRNHLILKVWLETNVLVK